MSVHKIALSNCHDPKGLFANIKKKCSDPNVGFELDGDKIIVTASDDLRTQEIININEFIRNMVREDSLLNN